MKTIDAVKFFKTKTALAKALGITKQAVTQWGEDVPYIRQLQIEKVSFGHLKAQLLEEALAK